MKKTLTVILTLWLLMDGLRAQDPQFSQFYASPLYLNPALAGNTIMGRLALSYRSQWAKLPGAFRATTFSYDHNFEEVNSGVGFLVVNDVAGSVKLNFQTMAFLYSYQKEASMGTHSTGQLQRTTFVGSTGLWSSFDV